MSDVYLWQSRDTDYDGCDTFCGVYKTIDGALASHYAECIEQRRPDRYRDEYEIVYNHAWVVRLDGTWEFYDYTDSNGYQYEEISTVTLGE